MVRGLHAQDSVSVYRLIYSTTTSMIDLNRKNIYHLQIALEYHVPL